MGKVKFTPEQQIVFDAFSKNRALCQKFYFTGGTALSVFHLQHRFSEDLDFFSEENFDNQLLLNFTTRVKSELTTKITFLEIDQIRVFEFFKNKKRVLKLDFNYYPFKRLKPSQKIQGVEVDDKFDIAVNKLITIAQRTQVKDFVDLYFLFEDFTLWDLIDGVKIKFGVKLEPFIIASDFLKVQDFDYLPQMTKPLTLEELKDFFTKRAKEIGRTVVE